ncbi:MAG: sigma-70 family RNA polymerase sigma factor [Hyphomicrobiaceae bacterium]
MLRVLAGQERTLSRPPTANGIAMGDLLRRIAIDRDAEAFEELFEQFAPRVKAVLMRQGADAATAEELAQETMLMVWRKASYYVEGRGNAATWIFTIARNLRIDRIRRNKSWAEVDDDLSTHVSEDIPPDEQAMQNQTQVLVGDALKHLPPDQLEVIRLSYMEGLSQSEIAARLSLPLGTVKSRMRLAYQRLRGAFEDLA